MSKGLGILCKAKRVLKLDTLVTLYYSFIYPYMLYCIGVWGSASKECMTSIYRLQKRAVRIIKSVPTRTESAPMFQSLELLSVFEIYMYKVMLFMYKSYHNLVADCVSDLFIRTNEIHDRDTRQSDKYYVQFTRLTSVQKSMRFRGPSACNYFYDNIDIDCPIATFKSILKRYLLSHDIQSLYQLIFVT